MGSHQRCVGKSQVHLTPRRILDPLGKFDLDPCGSNPRPWDCAGATFTEADDGLSLPWFGRVWLNPPFNRFGIADWLTRMAQHDRGITLVHARTETDWFNIVRERATALFWIAGRVIFLKPDGSPQTITKPTSKYFGKVANSGAPVVLAAFGFADSDVLAALPSPHDGAELGRGLFGHFDPLLIQRFVLIGAIKNATWRELVSDVLASQKGPIRVADLYRALRDHPKARRNPNWQAKLRQTLQRGAGVSIGRDQWAAAS
jgi:hypothetical protein